MNKNIYTISEIVNPEQKAQSCLEVTALLPDWFGLPEANEKYVEGIKETTVFAAHNHDGELLGLIAVKMPFPNNADIYWMGIKPSFHRQGIGKALLERAQEYARGHHCHTITVETLSLSHDDLSYKKTYQFYHAVGFSPLFELEPYDTGYHMLYMIRHVKKKSFAIYDDITITPAALADHSTIQNMGRFYVYDMSEYLGHLEGWEMPEDGLYECIDFKKYFEQKDSYPFLVRKGKELAGFVIIDKKGSDDNIDFNMAQFFILRKFKGCGVGKYVAQTCFDKFKGTWEVMVLPGNTGAYTFWKRSIQDYTGGNFTEYNRNIAHLNNCEKNIFKFKSK